MATGGDWAMSWTNRPTYWDAPGQVELGEDKQKILDQIEFLTSPPMAQLRQTVGQSISNGTFTALTFDTEGWDTYNGHSTVTNTSRYVVPVAGYYQLSGKVAWNGNTTGRRVSQWAVNGTGVTASQVAVTANSVSDVEHPTSTIDVLLALNDYVEILAWQDSGGALSTLVSNAQVYSYMNVRWVASA